MNLSFWRNLRDEIAYFTFFEKSSTQPATLSFRQGRRATGGVPPPCPRSSLALQSSVFDELSDGELLHSQPHKRQALMVAMSSFAGTTGLCWGVEIILSFWCCSGSLSRIASIEISYNVRESYIMLKYFYLSGQRRLSATTAPSSTPVRTPAD